MHAVPVENIRVAAAKTKIANDDIVNIVINAVIGNAVQRPSEAKTTVSPMRRLACMTLFSEPGEIMLGSGASLKCMSIVTSAPSALR
jgi:hypothetical protein